MAKHTMQELYQWQALPLNIKVLMTAERIRNWVNEFGEDGVYLSFSSGKDMDIWNYINEDVYNKQMKPLINRYRKYLVPKAEDENRYIDCWCKRQAKNGERI